MPSSDKGNGVVLIKIACYILSMTRLFSDKNKFRKVHFDSTLTELNTLQDYLRTILNRGEISNSEFNDMRPISTQPARAHGLPKIHKSFDTLPPFRPIIDTTGTACEPVAKFLTKLLNPLTINEFSIKDTFDAVSHINNLPRKLFDNGYRFFPLTSNLSLLMSVIVKPLINSGKIVFYKRHVDDLSYPPTLNIYLIHSIPLTVICSLLLTNFLTMTYIFSTFKYFKKVPLSTVHQLVLVNANITPATLYGRKKISWIRALIVPTKFAATRLLLCHGMVSPANLQENC